ncbi:MAG: GNAT family N-acetyltransferase [Cytophagaceae bacterium]|nr:GNAT family N-acetyltransferase [Cytophagaceae bacterium]
MVENWIVCSESIWLRPVAYEDAYSMAQLANEVEVWRQLRNYFPHPYSYDHAIRYIHHCHQVNEVRDFAIVADHVFCGVISFIPGDDVYVHTAEIGYWLGKPHWGKGIASLVVSSFVDYIFHKHSFLKLYARVFESNAASGKVLIKAGFHQEALLKKQLWKDGRVLDETIFARFRPDLS